MYHPGMYKPTDRQVPMWTRDKTLPESAARRLLDSWAEGFRRQVLPILMDAEESFAGLYSQETGRPNVSPRPAPSGAPLADLRRWALD